MTWRLVTSNWIQTDLQEINMSIKRVASLLALLVLGLGLASCERTTISDIVADPGSFTNKQVNVVGEVKQSMGALGMGLYQITDGTGDLWVLSESRGVPSKGARVGVKGRVTPTLTFMGKNYATVLRESDRKAEKAEKSTQ
jgi:hypothetical protein